MLISILILPHNMDMKMYFFMSMSVGRGKEVGLLFGFYLESITLRGVTIIKGFLKYIFNVKF
jgi:hypothetical protein